MAHRPKKFKIDWETVDKNFEEMKMFSKSRMECEVSTNNKVFSMASKYKIKDLDLSKRRFAEDTLLSKKYESILETNLKKWAKIFKFDHNGLP